ncbi:MAG: multiheme c-type cytochrome [Pirellulaceae bacterium]
MHTSFKILGLLALLVVGILGASAVQQRSASNDSLTSWQRSAYSEIQNKDDRESTFAEIESFIRNHFGQIYERTAADAPSQRASSSQLPDACLSGLPGLNLGPGGESDAMRASEIEAVRQLIEDPRFARAIHESSQSAPRHEATASHISSLPEDAASDSVVQNVNFDDYNPHARATADRVDVAHHASGAAGQPDCFDPHAEVFQESQFPSATQCAKCHEQIFDEWASSSHAYSAVSPMFHRFEDKINELTQGTIGYFCMRCHAPVATTVGLRRDQSIWDGPRVFREGVTCIACHRVKENYTKTNGERRIEPGDIHDPVYSGSGQLGSQIAAKYADYFKVKTDPSDQGPGQPMHRRAIEFEQLSQSDFCMSCHQVAVQPGIKLEVVWDQYRASPAWREGITCQECHMGIVPGRADGYSVGPAAVVDGKAVTPERKHSNHMFYGPGYSVAHPGVFPQNQKADRWRFNDWLQFDWRAGWGTEAFEDAVADGQISPLFPSAWAEPDDRMDARDIITENLNKLEFKRDIRRQVMENGSQLDGPFFQHDPAAGQALRFHYCVTNTNPGHNLPSGSLGAQPQLWLNVVLVGPDGNRLWESGYLDSVGDLADLHSQDVLERRVPLDKQLFNLQTKFLTSNVKGTDREMYLPINFDFDQLPFIRPAPQPVSVLNHPPFIRMEAHSIPPLGQRKAKYVIPAALIQQPGTYRLSVRLRSRAEPIYFMKFVDATPEMIRMMNEWIVDAHVQSVIFEVK